MTDKIIPCLWFNDTAEEAIDFYVDVFPDSRITKVHSYGEAGPGKPGSVMMIWFELGGRSFSALNGGVDFPFSEAVSLVYPCAGQAEIDRVWDRLADGGTPQQCGWIKDRYGLPWQIVPSTLDELISGDPAAANRVMTAIFGMVKLDLPTLERAHAG
jgi:predicted 3-demethylubiquinone-9 3-methyltransferase (glyoxalase superfamily)